MSTRRTFLKVLGGAGAAAMASHPLMQAFADPPNAQNEFFIFIHAAGGWDVTLSLDPRNDRRGIIEPATTDTIDPATMPLWRAKMLGEDETFEIVRPAGSNIPFGPAIGALADHHRRLTVINGIAVNTVSHPDGTFFAATGRHLSGGKPVSTSIDTLFANEFGSSQLFPVISVGFPSTFLDRTLDPRVSPLRVSAVDAVARVLARSNTNTMVDDRNAVTTMLTQEAQDLVRRSWFREAPQGFQFQYEALSRMLGSNIQAIFSSTSLRMLETAFSYNLRFQTRLPINCAFAVEAMERNVVRCVSFATSSHDTHNQNYRNQGAIQRELFDTLAALLQALDQARHPTLMGENLGAHTHILVVSEFCRTPQINASAGRDHYPNGSALIISPLFRGNTVFGSADADQLLPQGAGMFADGNRPIAPPDVLATLLGAFGVDPRKYLRDGDKVQALLRP